MSAAKEAERAAERMRALCHELYQPTTPQEAYQIVGSLDQAMRAFEQSCRQIADQLERLDPAGYRDDRDLDPFDTIQLASEMIRRGHASEAQNHLAHIGRAG